MRQEKLGDSWYGSAYLCREESRRSWHCISIRGIFWSANRGSFLQEEYGGVIRYQKHRDQEREKREAEIQETFKTHRITTAVRVKVVRNDQTKNQQRQYTIKESIRTYQIVQVLQSHYLWHSFEN